MVQNAPKAATVALSFNSCFKEVSGVDFFFFACLKKEIEDTKIIMLLGFASLTSNQGNKEKNNFIFAFFFFSISMKGIRNFLLFKVQRSVNTQIHTSPIFPAPTRGSSLKHTLLCHVFHRSTGSVFIFSKGWLKRRNK